MTSHIYAPEKISTFHTVSLNAIARAKVDHYSTQNGLWITKQFTFAENTDAVDIGRSKPKGAALTSGPDHSNLAIPKVQYQ